MCKFRNLTPADIDVRVQQVTKNGNVILVLYKDARCDMNILDETVGEANWQNRFYECKGNLFCSVGINIDGTWIWKDDCGSESNTEAQKGEASDARKRAGFAWGIGRELYSSPFICVTGDGSRAVVKEGKCFDKFSVSKFEVSQDKKITEVEIKNDSTHTTAFYWKRAGKVEVSVPANSEQDQRENAIAAVLKHSARLTRGSVDKWISMMYGKGAELSRLTTEQFEKLFSALSDSINKEITVA